jgi:hypothetical protein
MRRDKPLPPRLASRLWRTELRFQTSGCRLGVSFVITVAKVNQAMRVRCALCADLQAASFTSSLEIS